MKKQLSTIKGAALILCLIIALGFVGITADTASGGKAQAAIHEIGEKVQASFHRLLSDEAEQIVNETVSLPVQVYASDLTGIDENYLILANERGLLIYDRGQEKLYLFNETGIEQRAGKETASSLPEFAYICDLSMLASQTAERNSEASSGNNELNINLTSDTNIDNTDYLRRTTDIEVIRGIHDLWMNDAKNRIRDTFDSFYGSEFLNSDAETTADPDTLPPFTYTGDDEVLATVCAYMIASENMEFYYYSSEDSVYIPEPLILDVKQKGDDLIIFCNLWHHGYYRNGNTLECKSGGEAPARLQLHPDPDAPGGYQVIEDLRTGDGSEYEKGIKEFCKGYPGMKRKYFSDYTSKRNEIRTALIRMYVQDNGLDIRYYKDFGWDPVPVN